MGVFSGSGRLLSVAERSYAVNHLPGGRSEVEASVIEAALISALDQAAALERPTRIALGTFMHSLILLDEHFRPLSPLSLWSDRRATEQCERFQARHDPLQWRQLTGCILGPSIPFFRVLWYREHEPELFSRVAAVASIQSFLMHRFTGRLVEEYASAISCGWCNLETGSPEEGLASLMGLSLTQLPEPLAADRGFELLGRAPLPEAVPRSVWLHPAGADGPLSHLGSAGRDPGAISLTIGTSLAVRKVLASEFRAAEAPRDCWAVRVGPSLLGGIASNNGGNVARAMADLVAVDSMEDMRVLADRACAAPFRPGLLFRPYLFAERHLEGERGCLWRRTDGLAVEHLDLFRCALEGIVFHAVHLAERLAALAEIERVHLSGGLVALPFVSDLLAKLLPRPVFASSAAGSAPLLGALTLAFPDDFGPPASPSAASRIIPSGRLAFLQESYQEKYGAWKEWLSTGAAGSRTK